MGSQEADVGQYESSIDILAPPQGNYPVIAVNKWRYSTGSIYWAIAYRILRISCWHKFGPTGLH